MTSRGQPPAGWYTASTAREKLGNISDGKLRTLIGTGENQIERWTPPGYTQGFYKASDVNKLTRNWEKERKQKEGPSKLPINFRRMEIEEMPIVAEVLHKLFD